MMADEFNFLRPDIKNYKAEADADLIPIPGQLELHGRCRCGVLLSTCFCALFVADLIVGMEELELHYRRRGRYNFRKIRIATIAVRMVPARDAPKDQNKHSLQILAPTPSSVSSKQEQTYTISHRLVEHTPAEDLPAAGGVQIRAGSEPADTVCSC